MIEVGQNLSGGEHRHIQWICGRMEEIQMRPPYGLITAGDSLPWMDWDVVLPRFAEALVPGAYLALVGRSHGGEFPAEADLIHEYSTNQDYEPYDLVEELEKHGLFRKAGNWRSEAEPWAPTVAEYIQMRHSTNGFSRDRMGEIQATRFDLELSSALEPFASSNGTLKLTVTGSITWGRLPN